MAREELAAVDYGAPKAALEAAANQLTAGDRRWWGLCPHRYEGGRASNHDAGRSVSTGV